MFNNGRLKENQSDSALPLSLCVCFFLSVFSLLLFDNNWKERNFWMHRHNFTDTFFDYFDDLFVVCRHQSYRMMFVQQINELFK